MSLCLIDTSVWARLKQPAVANLIAQAIEAGSAVIIAPLVLELLRSARSAKEMSELSLEYDALLEVPLSPELGQRARQVQLALAARGYHRGPSPVDLLCAAAAEAVGAELWHCDRHFELIAAITGQAQRRVGT